MGLDCIPHVYPCRKAGTDIKTEDGRIDCDATRAADQCPWKPAAEAAGSPVYGILGTPCWYRGKAGNYYIDAVQEAGHPLPVSINGGFYGQEGNEPPLSPAYCKELGDWMAERVEVFASTLAHPSPDFRVLDASERKGALDAYRYAAWWLRWIAEAGDGSDTWY
jgi:hypothetical protein